MTYSVLLKTDVNPLPTDELGKLRAKALGGVAYDSIARLNRCFGWVAEGLDQDAAGSLVKALEEGGFAAGTKEDVAFTSFASDYRVQRAELSEESLVIQTDALGRTQTVEWRDVALVSVGRVPDPTLKTKVVRQGAFDSVVGQVIHEGDMGDSLVLTARIVEEKAALLHVYVKSPPFIVSIRPTSFFYDYLGDRRSLVAAENFGLLIADLQKFAADAYWSTRTKEYIDNGPQAAGDFKNVAEFERYGQWLYEAFAAE